MRYSSHSVLVHSLGVCAVFFSVGSAFMLEATFLKREPLQEVFEKFVC